MPSTGTERTGKNRRHPCRLAYFFTSAIICTNLYAADINTEQVEKSHELENIRLKIKNVESDIEQASEKIDSLYQSLREKESAAVEARENLEHYTQQIKDKQQQLEALSLDKTNQETKLNSQRAYLSQQIRAAYKTGRSNYLKLVLNQENPDLVGRMLAYHEYDSRARSKRINEISDILEGITKIETQIKLETSELATLSNHQQKVLTDYQQFRQSREDIVIQLQSFITSQSDELQTLSRNEKEIGALVEQIESKDLTIQLFEDMPPFGSLRGQLDWPVKGKIVSRFGNLRKGGKLEWQGVTIAAKSGLEVKAISTGKVVFADWFKSMGLLIILDHGDGFMSLYGHNDRLLKKPGDWVIADDIIARVGDTGGQNRAALYFEIRKSGNPVNPALWCKY